MFGFVTVRAFGYRQPGDSSPFEVRQPHQFIVNPGLEDVGDENLPMKTLFATFGLQCLFLFSCSLGNSSARQEGGSASSMKEPAG